jgi:hypothetical protein
VLLEIPFSVAIFSLKMPSVRAAARRRLVRGAAIRKFVPRTISKLPLLHRRFSRGKNNFRNNK